MKRYFAVLGLVLGLSHSLMGANFPYPQSRSYSYGFKPAAISGSWATDGATILGYYNAWLTAHRVTVSTGVYRINVTESSDSHYGGTVSEGISYGMILAVYFNDQATFDGLWAYKQSHNDGLGLMNWWISGSGGTSGANSAADADQEITYALYLAYYQWGTGLAGGPIAGQSYKTLGDAELLKITAYDLDSDRIRPGDAFDSCRYPSYFFPNEYRVFANQSGDSATWNAVRTNCYNTLAAARNNTTGLLAEICTDTGQGGGCGDSSTQYLYNSCRIPYRMALDYVDYGDANASAELGKLNSASMFGNIAPGSVVDGYNLSGSTAGSYNAGSFVGPAGTSFMQSGSASLQTYYSNLMGATQNEGRYFDGALWLMSLLLLSGNMPNIADQGAMFTPTMTRTQTPYAGTPTMTPTQTPVAFAYIFEDFEHAFLVNSYTFAGGGATLPTVSQGISNAFAQSGTFSDKMVVQMPLSANYAGAGFDSSYAPALTGVMNFAGAVTVRLAVKTDTLVSIVVNFREGNGVNGGDDEVWESPAQTVPASANWQVLNIAVSSFTENMYNPSCNPTGLPAASSPCKTMGNNTFDLGSIKTCELDFNPIIATAANVYVDNVAFIPGVVPTMTPTKTPFANPYNVIFDDFESPLSLSTTAPKRVTSYADTANAATAAWAIDTTTFADGTKAGRLDYNLGTTGVSYGCGGTFISPYATGVFTASGGMAGAYFDGSNSVSLQYWIKAPAGLVYQMTWQEAGNTAVPVAGADGEAWYSNYLTANGGWQRVTVDLGDMTEDPYNTLCNPTGITAPGPCLTGANPGNNTRNPNAAWMVGVKLPGGQVGVASRSGSVYFDDVDFVTSFRSPTVSPTPTLGAGTATPTMSPSSTRTPTVTPSMTPTASPSNSPSATASPSRTATVTLSVSPSPSASPSGSPSPSVSPSGSPSGTPTLSRTPSPSGTATRTPSVSPTVTPTNTNVPPGSTATDTPTVSPVLSGTPSSTPAISDTFTATVTASRTETPTVTPTLTLVVTDTDTLTATQTGTPALFTATDSPTPAPPTATATVPLPTATSTITVTGTPTSTVALSTATPSGTVTVPTVTPASPTSSFTATLAPSGTATLTSSPQVTVALPSATATPTQSPIVTSPAPVLGSLAPAQLSSVGTQTLTLNGQFLATDVVIIQGPGAAGNVTLTPQTFTTGQLTVLVSPLAVGSYTVVVRDGASGAQSASQALTVKAPGSGNTGPLIVETHPVPNPNPTSIWVLLNYPAEQVVLKVYSQSMAMMGSTKLGAQAAGWVSVPLPWTGHGAMGSGTYYYVVSARRNGSEAKAPKIGRLVISR
jgi:endo-1,4-beta-D-glucanase Y